MTVFGIPFGPVTATISALAIGIGIPYMIHITHRFLEDRERTNSVGEAIELTLSNTGGALAGSAITIVAGFGILVTSTTIPFRQFGLRDGVHHPAGDVGGGAGVAVDAGSVGPLAPAPRLTP